MTRSRIKFRMENLEAREMMAADFGLPNAPAFAPIAGEVVEISSAAPGASGAQRGTSQATESDQFAITPNWYVNRLNLIISGTEFNDKIEINTLNNGWIEVKATTTNDAGTELGTKTETFHPNTFVNIFAVGADGNDTIRNNVSNKTMVAYGGNGDDILISEGRANLFGQGGDDTIWGSSQNDYLSGGDGEDFLYGREGDDIIVGGFKDDMLLGGSGNDTMIGDSGNDRMYGHAGNDIMHGANGEDLLKGGFGDDIMFGGNGDDELFGDSGNDILRGMNGEDRLDGGSGHDRLDGGANNDLLIGGSGNDELIGRGGFDMLFGGQGNDILDGGDDGISDLQHGGAGADTFVRHKHLGADDPDNFLDLDPDEGDERENDWAWANYGNGFPDENDYFG